MKTRMSNAMRQGHRWVSILFMLCAVANVVAMAVVGTPPDWITYSPLLPLAVMLLTGLYLFALPYMAKRSGVMSETDSRGKRDGEEGR
jgi:hypothetical protein